MNWNNSVFFVLFILIFGIPFYQLETIRYRNIYNECFSTWEKDRELSSINICSDPQFREYFKGRVDCEGASKSAFIDPKECAFVKWWGTFTLTVYYNSISGSWYLYALIATILVVYVWTWVTSNGKVKMRKEELKAQSKLLMQFNDQMTIRHPHNRHRQLALPTSAPRRRRRRRRRKRHGSQAESYYHCNSSSSISSNDSDDDDDNRFYNTTVRIEEMD